MLLTGLVERGGIVARFPSPQMAPGDTAVDPGGEFHLPASHGVMRKSVPTEKYPTTAPDCPRTPQPHVAPPTADCLDPRRDPTRRTCRVSQGQPLPPHLRRARWPLPR